ncbi:hypothetical protein DS043_15405 [Escherichia coli]|uniref:Uncharacterized protein n=1 Tax=Escherichia coli TaxID=562 RepID=A0AAU8ZUM1_ECOLX|nr:hypothetical protein AM346_15570 [Escherichia coli]NHY58482.1 hypothetical protein [Klebsiella pneumoniae]AUZ07181.1 hypothetical protein BWI88_03710 [Escherichia coli]AXG16145.1 hypothetical protein C6669_03390 [Escherichia coli]EEV9899346.1 hypothetical protein [Escherichia coli]
MTVHRDKFKLIFVFHMSRDLYFSLLLDFYSSPLFTRIQHYSIYSIKCVLCLFENSKLNLPTLGCISRKYP